MKILTTLFLSILYGTIAPFNIGETLIYNASFSGIPAGRATLKVIKEDNIQNKKTFHIQFKAKTSGITNYLFPINNTIDIWLDQKSLLPIRIKEKISEGKYKKSMELNYFENKRLVIINNKDTMNIKSNFHSPYSLFYFFRNNDFNNLKKQPIVIFQGKFFESLYINIKNNVEINSKIGDYICTKVTPKRINKKKFKNETTMNIWFSNNSKKYPLQNWLKMKYGGLLLELREIIN